MNPFNSEKANQGSAAKFSQVPLPIEQILSSILIRRMAKRNAAMKTDARIDSVTGQGEEKSHTESEPASESSPRLLNSQPGAADSSGHAIGMPSPSSSGLQVAGMKRGHSEVTLGSRGPTGKKSKLASVAASYSEVEISGADENEDGKSGSELEENQKDDLDPEFSAAELAKMYHWQLADELRDILDDKEQVQSSDKNRERMIKITEVMEKKFREATHPNEKTKPRKAPRTEYPVKEKDYLRKFSGKEEDNHPFMPRNLYQNGTIPTLPPLARSWDSKSKAKITDSKVGFLSGASGWVEKGTLDTANGRMESIARHCNWRSRMQTVFISTTTDWKEIFYDRMPHMDYRQENSGLTPNTKLSCINPNARLAKGLPVLKLSREIDHYEIGTTYGYMSGRRKIYFASKHLGLKLGSKAAEGHSYPFFKNEYLLPFNVGPDEIVATWTFDAIKNQMLERSWTYEQWWQNEFCAKYEAHEKARLEGKKVEHEAGCSCCGHI